MVKKSSDIITFQLLDNAYEQFLKRILWKETNSLGITPDDRIQLANVMISVLERTVETIEIGAIPEEIRIILQYTAEEIDAIFLAIDKNRREIAAENAGIGDIDESDE